MIPSRLLPMLLVPGVGMGGGATPATSDPTTGFTAAARPTAFTAGSRSTTFVAASRSTVWIAEAPR